MRIHTILLDMDEVLVDFVGGACRAHDVSDADLRAHWEPGTWSIVEPIGRAKREQESPHGFGLYSTPFTVADLWRPINADGEAFWTRLQPLPWIHDMLRLTTAAVIDWHIVSAPSQSPESYSGKVKWMKRFFGPGFDRFILTPHKHLFAKPGALLIDDREENINNFIEAGGAGIVFPTRGNRLHRSADDPMQYVRQQFTTLFSQELSCTSRPGT